MPLDIQTSKTSTENHLEDKLTSLQVVFPANRSAFQGKDKAQRTKDSCGRSSTVSLLKFNHWSFWRKTLVDCLVFKTAWCSSVFALTWKIKVTKSNRLLFQLAPLVRRTGETGFGLLHTPTSVNIVRSEDALVKRKAFRESIGRKTVPYGNLAEQLANVLILPTPTASDIKSRGPNSKQIGMDNFMKLLPTPLTNSWKGGGRLIDGKNQGKKGERPLILEQIVGSMNNGQKHGMKLQPNFVEWMMGFPENWTKIETTD